MCALVQVYVKEAFYPGNNGTWSTFFNDGDQPSLSQGLECAWYLPGKLNLVRDNLTNLFFNLESFAIGGRWLSLLGLPDVVLALPKDRIWKYLLFGRPYLNYLDNKDIGVQWYWLDVRRSYWLATPEEASCHRKFGASLVVPRFGIRAADEKWRRLRDSCYEENTIWSIECLGRDELLHFGAIPSHLAGRYDWFHASEFIAPRALFSTLQHSGN